MALEQNELREPIRKLRKRLKRLSEDPGGEEVHKLRTLARRLEAIVAALQLERKHAGRRLLKRLAPIRKAAGQVRDMDVLSAKALSLPRTEEDDLVRLIEHLGQKRVKTAGALFKKVAKERKELRNELRECLGMVKRIMEKRGSSAGQEEGSSPGTAAAVAMGYIAELSGWPPLEEATIHSFRIKVKTLHYTLQLAGKTDEPFVKALGELKDVIGDWHDWRELRELAREVLKQADKSALLRAIEQRDATKLKQAIASANRLRGQYLNPRRPYVTSVVQAAARLAG